MTGNRRDLSQVHRVCQGVSVTFATQISLTLTLKYVFKQVEDFAGA